MMKIGDLYEKPEGITFEWRIKNFSSLSDKIDVHYESPKFYFSSASWEIRMYPNGEKNYHSDGWISLFIKRVSSGLPISVTCCFDLKTADGKTHSGGGATRTFEGPGDGMGITKLITRESLMKGIKSDVTSSAILTVICTLKSHEFQAMDCSLFSRQQEICDNLKEIYEKAKETDFTLQVKGTSIPAHRIILETRSPVFAAMLNHNTKENRTGIVCIDDLEISAVKSILEYMYCGDINNMTNENVIPVYVAADKYDIKNVKEICLEFIKMNLAEEWVCDVIKFADLYNEEEIGRCATEFFKKNGRKILRTEKWKTFAKENHELLDSLIEALLPE